MIGYFVISAGQLVSGIFFSLLTARPEDRKADLPLICIVQRKLAHKRKECFLAMSLTSSKKIDTNKVEMEVSVEEQQFQSAVMQAYKKNVKKITIPGFRKGKAPKAMIEKMYGSDFFYEDAINMVYPTAYEEAVEEANIEPVDRAEVSDLKFNENGAGFTFKATVTVKPEVEVKDYKGIKVEKSLDAVTDADVDAEIDKMRERNARLVTVEGRAAKMGDTVNIDFEGFLDGVAFQGGKGTDVNLLLGSGQFIPGFEESIVDKNIGDEFDIDVTFPDNYHNEDMRGKATIFKTKLNGIQEKELPELDDEFVKDVSEFDTLDELKKDLKEKLEKAAQDKAQNAVENDIITKIIENMTGEIPEVMIENKTTEMLNDFGYRLQSQGMNMDMYLHYTGMDIDEFRKTFVPSAERQVKIRLALEKIADEEKILVTDEEVAAEYEKMAKNYGIDVEKVKSFLPEKDIRKDVAVNKAIDLVRDEAKITEKKARKPRAKKSTENVDTTETSSEE